MSSKELKFDEFVTLFVNSVDLENLRILRAQEIVFFCGGKIDSVNTAQTAPGSFRSFLHHKIDNDVSMKDINFVRAEELANWYFDALKDGIHFEDLLRFETQMSYLAALTCIVLESAGAIAELGAFSVIDEFQNRIMVIVRDKEYAEKSFISLGPIRKLQNEYGDEGGIFVYEWDVTFSIGEKGEVVKKLNADQLDLLYWQFCADLRQSIEFAHKSEKFQPENMRHIFLLIVDLVAVFHCLKLGEIRKLIVHFNVNFQPKMIKVCLFFAVKLGLIQKTRYGGADYYTSKASKEFAEYNFSKSSKAKFSRAPFKMNVRKAIGETEKQREYVLQRLKKELDGEGDE